MSTSDRRRIVRAVNRGQVLENRTEAALAVVLARRQQRFWRVAMIAAPVISIVVSFALERDADLLLLVANAAVGAVVLLAMGMFFIRRAVRAEAGNEQRAVHGRLPRE